MQLLVIRHAKAEDDHPDGDAARALTGPGQEKFRRAVRGLSHLVPAIDVLASSPLRRARQTAGLIAEQYPGVIVEELPALSPGARAKTLLPWLARQANDTCVAVVGHEPDLSLLITELTTGSPSPFLSMKKGAVCLLEFSGEPAIARAQLQWLLSAGQLQRIGG